MIELILFFAAGFYIGWKLNDYIRTTATMILFKELGIKEKDLRDLAQKNGLELPEDNSEDSEDDLEEIHIKVEQHGTEIYAFRVDNDEFIAQGKDRESLVNRIAQRYSNVRMIVDEGKELLQESHS